MSSPSNLEVNSADSQPALMRGQINIATVWVRGSRTRVCNFLQNEGHEDCIFFFCRVFGGMKFF